MSITLYPPPRHLPAHPQHLGNGKCGRDRSLRRRRAPSNSGSGGVLKELAGLEVSRSALCRALLRLGVYAGWSTELVYQKLVREAEEALAETLASNVNGAQGAAPSLLSTPSLEDLIPEGVGGWVEDMKSEDGKDLSQAQRSREEGELSVALKHALQAQAMVQGVDSLVDAFSRAVEPRSPGFDARQELAAFLAATIGRDDYTWSRLNPRYLSAGVCLPSLSASLALVDGIIAIDTSSSVTPRLLSFMAGACEDLLTAYPQSLLRVLYCDTEVRSTEVITAYDRPVTLSQAQGGGGTRFAPVFDWVSENGFHPTFLLYMTDLDGPSPPDPGYPVIWLAIDAVHPTPPFGRRIDLSSLD
jgi:VWA-like protein DUF2201/putative metallopeptidase-like protein